MHALLTNNARQTKLKGQTKKWWNPVSVCGARRDEGCGIFPQSQVDRYVIYLRPPSPKWLVRTTHLPIVAATASVPVSAISPVAAVASAWTRTSIGGERSPDGWTTHCESTRKRRSDTMASASADPFHVLDGGSNCSSFCPTSPQGYIDSSGQLPHHERYGANPKKKFYLLRSHNAYSTGTMFEQKAMCNPHFFLRYLTLRFVRNNHECSLSCRYSLMNASVQILSSNASRIWPMTLDKARIVVEIEIVLWKQDLEINRVWSIQTCFDGSMICMFWCMLETVSRANQMTLQNCLEIYTHLLHRNKNHGETSLAVSETQVFNCHIGLFHQRIHNGTISWNPLQKLKRGTSRKKRIWWEHEMPS